MSPEELYLDLLKKCLTRLIFSETPDTERQDSRLRALPTHPTPEELSIRREGRDWPAEAETMIGIKRLDSLQQCVIDVVRSSVPGDLVEAGVWRGGASIFMRGVLAAFGDNERVVWVADSFQGLPEPSRDRYPTDADNTLYLEQDLVVSLEEVRANFARYGLLDDRVRFIEGWFRDTLGAAPIEQVAVLRLDGDLYESTIDALRHLYPKLSRGGYCIIDDYGAYPECRAAVDDYRSRYMITDELQWIDWTGVFWTRSNESMRT